MPPGGSGGSLKLLATRKPLPGSGGSIFKIYPQYNHLLDECDGFLAVGSLPPAVPTTGQLKHSFRNRCDPSVQNLTKALASSEPQPGHEDCPKPTASGLPLSASSSLSPLCILLTLYKSHFPRAYH